MLKANDIHKSYGNLKVLKGVTLEVNKGEIISIVGASGAGKSTLLQILGTLDDPDQGYLDINNLRIEGKPKVDLQCAEWWKRAVNVLIDLGVIGGITFLVLSFIPKGILNLNYVQDQTGTIETKINFLDPVVLLLFVTVTFLYYTLFEGFTGRTIGKLCTHTKVIVKEQASFPGFFRSLLRSLSRFLPFEFISFFKSRPSGFHDTAAGTLVVNASVKYEPVAKKSLSDKEISIFRNKNIGFVFQFHNLLPEFSALENVCMPGFIGNKDEQHVKSRAMELLDLLGISHRADHKPSQLSGGEQQRVAIARALINDPILVFADEPSGNLDSHNAEELHKLFFRLRDTLKQTFIIVTHNEKLANMADRKLEIVDGKISGGIGEVLI